MDNLTPAERSEIMSRVKSKNTRPEILVRSFLHQHGLRFSLNRTALPGKPDIILRKYKAVVFVNGCFWHKHEGCRYFVWLKNNAEFWKKKIAGNVERDLRQQNELRLLGWNVVVIWECELKKDRFNETMASVTDNLRNNVTIPG